MGQTIFDLSSILGASLTFVGITVGNRLEDLEDPKNSGKTAYNTSSPK